jgi:O-succinylbenzoic acid--CoA ligase
MVSPRGVTEPVTDPVENASMAFGALAPAGVTPLALWLPWRAVTTPDRLALVSPDGARFTYAEQHARADDEARRLATLGVRGGDRVGVLLSNGATFAAVVHACMRLGAVLLPLNLRLTPGELAWQGGDAGARVLLFGGSTES